MDIFPRAGPQRKYKVVFRAHALEGYPPSLEKAQRTMTNADDRKPASQDSGLVLEIAALARLDVSPEEARLLAPQFASILAQFEGLARLDVTGIEPLVSLSGADTVLRADEPEPSLAADVMLANAPERVLDFYAVPKTVGGEE